MVVFVSIEAGFVEHRDECGAAAVLFAKFRDARCEPVALTAGLGGAAGVLEDGNRAGVCGAAGLEQDVISGEHVPGQCLLGVLCLAGLGEAQASLQSGVPVGILVGDLPGLLDITLGEQRVDELAEVALA